MLLKLTSEHHQHLQFLNSIEQDVAIEFASISLKFLNSGINKKVIKSAAQKLGVSIETVENCILGIMQLFLEATKSKLNEEEFFDSMIVHNFSTELSKSLQSLYREQVKETRSKLKQNAPALSTYKNLEWRLDVKLASRALYNQLDPSILLKLATDDSDGSNKIELLKVDISMLNKLISELEMALSEDKVKHVQRFLRNIT